MTNLHPKVAASSILALLAVVVLDILNHQGITVSPDLTAAITAVVGSLAGYFTPSPTPTAVAFSGASGSSATFTPLTPPTV